MDIMVKTVRFRTGKVKRVEVTPVIASAPFSIASKSLAA
jgi:hypothetical protein